MAASSSKANEQIDRLESGIASVLQRRETAAKLIAEAAEAEINDLLQAVDEHPGGEEGIPLVQPAEAPDELSTRNHGGNSATPLAGATTINRRRRTCEPALGWLWDLIGV